MPHLIQVNYKCGINGVYKRRETTYVSLGWQQRQSTLWALSLMAEDLNGKWYRLSDSSPLTGGSAYLIPSHPMFPHGATAALERLWG